MPRLAPAVVIFEKRPRWEAELKRRLAADRVLVRPCRSAGDLLNLCQLMPGSVLVIDLEVGIKPALQSLERALLARHELHPLIVATVELRALEWTFRELGALAVLPDSSRGDELAAVCRRIFAAS